MIYVVIGILVLIIIYIFVMYNIFVSHNNRVNEAFSTMDVYLKKRWDLIPNLVETVKGYSKHEEKVLKDVTKLRSGVYDKMSDEEKIDSNIKLSNGLSKIIALVESYPDLKASDNYKDLSKQLTQVEDDIANSRKYYNGTVREYNNVVQMFPSNIVATIFGYKVKKMFEASDEEKENVKVKL